jgi:hypothetical protein
MMITEKRDEALSISNPRLLSAAYFGLLAIIVTVLIDSIMYALGFEQIIPHFKAILLAVIIAALFGALFGERIVHSKQPYRKSAFFWAFFMVILALPFYALGFLWLTQQSHSDLFGHPTATHWIYIYLLILVYSFIIAGIWVAVLAGLAAIFLRGFLVYYLVHSLYKKRQPPQDHLVDEHSQSFNLDTPPPQQKNYQDD